MASRTLRDLHRYAANISILFPELPVVERPAAAARAGFDAIELWWPFQGLEPSAQEERELIRAVHDAEVEVVCLNFSSGDRERGARGLVSRPPDVDSFRTNVRAVIRLAGELACPVLHAPFGNRLESITWVLQREHAIEQLAYAAQAAASVGATVVVEAQNPTDAPTYPLRTTVDAVDIATAATARAGVPVRITFDAYHMLQTEGDLLRTVRANLGAIAHVQIAEVPGRGAPGSGRLPVTALLCELADLGYAGAVGLEYHPGTSTSASFGWLDAAVDAAAGDQPPPDVGRNSGAGGREAGRLRRSSVIRTNSIEYSKRDGRPRGSTMARTYRIGVLQGDGIGPEIVPAAVRILDAAAAPVDGELFDWVHLPMGWEAIEKHGTPMPEDTVVALQDCDGWIIGPHDNQAYPPNVTQTRPPGGELRKHYDLYANIRPCRNFPGIEGVVTDTDLVVVRENTEGFYADRNMHVGVGEFMPTPDVAMSVGVFTRPAIERIAHTAFRLASGRRKKVTIVHKTNVLKLTTGLFRDVSLEVAQQYPDVEVDELLVDAATAHLVRRADSFDVILTENMFGDILSDLAGELVGALGLSPSINASDTHAMAQAAHGAAPDIAGQGLANPVGIVLSSVMLLRWLAERHDDPHLLRVADAVESAVADTLAAGVRTADLGGSHATEAFAASIAERCGRA